MTIPNINSVRAEALDPLEKEYDLEQSLARYPSLMVELIKFVNSLGLTDEKDASRALFVADYIFTSSEVPPPPSITDEQRREDIAKMFLIGLNRTSSDVLLRIFYLATKTQSMIRRADLFMAGKGEKRNAILITLKDLFIDAYLKICAELMGERPCGWELALLASSMNKTLPGKEYDKYKNAPSRSDTSHLFPYIWTLLTDYNKISKTEVNNEVLIPYIESSATLLGMGTKKPLFSIWNFNAEQTLKENSDILKELQTFVTQSDDTRPFMYLRAKILNTNEQVFLLRDPENEKPFFLLQSTVDEVNVTEILTLLRNRAIDIGKNAELIQVRSPVQKEEAEPHEKLPVLNPPKNTAENSVPTTLKTEYPRVGKKGFFQKIKSFFSKDKPAPVAERLQEKKQPVKIKESRKQVSKTKKSINKPYSNLPDFVSYALGVVAVGDLNLFQIFDTLRESNYSFSGVLYSDFSANESTFYASKDIDDPKSLTSILDGLDQVIEKTINHFQGGTTQIMPKEILFKGRTVDINFVIIFEGNKDHLVGIMGTTYVKDDSIYTGPTEGPETFQRRTLKMRTNQLLKTLESVKRFEDVFIRVLGEDLLKQCLKHEFDHAILNIYT